MTEQHRLSKMSKRIGKRYPQSVYFNKRKQRYVRSYRDKLSRYLKKRNNKIVRRVDDLPNGNAYRKVSEFWWDYC